jgi:hypothetical protein
MERYSIGKPLNLWSRTMPLYSDVTPRRERQESDIPGRVRHKAFVEQMVDSRTLSSNGRGPS